MIWVVIFLPVFAANVFCAAEHKSTANAFVAGLMLMDFIHRGVRHLLAVAQ